MTNGFDMQKQRLYALGLIKHIYFRLCVNAM